MERVLITASDPRFQFQMDLGQWWFQWTGLPFVFAVWAARPGIDEPRELERLLSESRDEGVDNFEQIARQEASRYCLSTDECLTYFQKYLRYYFGEQEQTALSRFREQAMSIRDRRMRTRSTVCN